MTGVKHLRAAHESSQHNSVHCSQQVHSRKSSRHFLLVGVPFSGSFAGESRQKKENGGSRSKIVALVYQRATVSV